MNVSQCWFFQNVPSLYTTTKKKNCPCLFNHVALCYILTPSWFSINPAIGHKTKHYWAHNYSSHIPLRLPLPCLPHADTPRGDGPLHPNKCASIRGEIILIRDRCINSSETGDRTGEEVWPGLDKVVNSGFTDIDRHCKKFNSNSYYVLFIRMTWILGLLLCAFPWFMQIWIWVKWNENFFYSNKVCKMPAVPSFRDQMLIIQMFV